MGVCVILAHAYYYEEGHGKIGVGRVENEKGWRREPGGYIVNEA